MEESNDIFLAGGDALVCLAVFVWGNPFSTYVSYDPS